MAFCIVEPLPMCMQSAASSIQLSTCCFKVLYTGAAAEGRCKGRQWNGEGFQHPAQQPGTWQDGFHYLREEQEHLREKKLLLLRKPEMQQLSMWSWYWSESVADKGV